MGRASRKSTGAVEVSSGQSKWTETHPDRELWTPHQRALAESMSQEAYEAVYGRGSSEAKFWESPRFRQSLRSEQLARIYSLADLDAFLEENYVGGPAEGISEDEALRALWDSEWARAEKLGREIDYPWTEMYKDEEIEELRQSWVKEVAGSWPGSGPRSILWIHLQRVGGNHLAYTLRALRQSKPGRAEAFFQEELLPEIEALAAPEGNPPPASLARQLWEIAAGNDEYLDIEAHQEMLVELVERGGGSRAEFMETPMPGTRWQDRYGKEPSLFQEALVETPWHLLRNGQQKEALIEAAEQVFRRHIEQLYYGIGASASPAARTEQLWQERHRSLQKGKEPGLSPLENFRPLFRAEGREDQLDRLLEVVDVELAEASSPAGAQALGKKISENAFLQGALGDGREFSEQIAGIVVDAVTDGSIRK